MRQEIGAFKRSLQDLKIVITTDPWRRRFERGLPQFEWSGRRSLHHRQDNEGRNQAGSWITCLPGRGNIVPLMAEGYVRRFEPAKFFLYSNPVEYTAYECTGKASFALFSSFLSARMDRTDQTGADTESRLTRVWRYSSRNPTPKCWVH